MAHSIHSPQLAAALLSAAAAAESIRTAVFLELAAFASGRKPALRLVIDSNDVPALLSAVNDFDHIDTAVRSISISSISNSWGEISSSTCNTPHALLVLDHFGSASELLDAELSDSYASGLRLGYPPCCVAALGTHRSNPGAWPLQLLNGLGEGTSVDHRVNRFCAEWGGIGLLGELFPCSVHCPAAKDYADGLLHSAVSLGLNRLADIAVKHAKTSVYISSDGEINLHGKPHELVDFY